MNSESSAAQPRHHVVGGERRGALRLADALGVVLEAAQQRGAQARFVSAAVRRRDGVAVGMDEAVLDGGPGDRPFDRAVLAVLLDLAGEGLVDDQFLPLDVGGEIVLQAAGKMEGRLGGDLAFGVDERGRAAPANFHAAEQIGLGARHLEQPRRVEARTSCRKSARRDGSARACRGGWGPCRPLRAW